MKWTIGTKIGGGFALALAALAVIGVVSYHSTTGLIDTATAVQHSHLVIENLKDLISTMKDAETGQRGFLVTGEQRYLEPYTAAVGQADQILKVVGDLTQDNSDQKQRVADLEPLIRNKFAEQQGKPSTCGATRPRGLKRPNKSC